MVHRRKIAAAAVALGCFLIPSSPAHADDDTSRPRDCQEWRRSCESECERRRREPDDAKDDADDDAETDAATTNGVLRVVEAAVRDVAAEGRRLAESSRGRQGRPPRLQGDDDVVCAPAPVVPEAPLGILLPASAAAAIGAVAVVQSRRRRRLIIG